MQNLKMRKMMLFGVMALFLLSISAFAQEGNTPIKKDEFPDGYGMILSKYNPGETYRICKEDECRDYQVKIIEMGSDLVSPSEAAEDNMVDYVILEVNGELTAKINEGESYILSDGAELNVRGIINDDVDDRHVMLFLIDNEIGTSVEMFQEQQELEWGRLGANKPFDLSNYPELFVKDGHLNAYFVVGENAPAMDNLAMTDIAASLHDVQIIDAVKLDSQIGSLNRNLIVVGRINLENKVADFLEHGPSGNLNPGEGMIKLYENNGYVQMLVTGFSPEDTRKAARVLAKYKKYGLSGAEAIITGSMDDPQVRISSSAVAQTPAEELPWVGTGAIGTAPTQPVIPSESGSTAYPTPAGVLPTPVGVPQAGNYQKEGCADGCKVNGNCLPYGTRLIKEGDQVYCNIDQTLQEQQGLDANCQNNYECLSNQCNGGLCADLQQLTKELKETNSLLARILAWIERIFS